MDDKQPTKQALMGRCERKNTKRQTKNEVTPRSAGRPGANENQGLEAVIVEQGSWKKITTKPWVLLAELDKMEPKPQCAEQQGN